MATKSRKSESKIAIPKDQWELPVTYDTEGQPVTLQDVRKHPADRALLSLSELDEDTKADLVATRIAMQPTFELAMIGSGVVDKQSAIEAVRAKTDVGRTLMEIEQRVIARLMQAIKQNAEDTV